MPNDALELPSSYGKTFIELFWRGRGHTAPHSLVET